MGGIAFLLAVSFVLSFMDKTSSINSIMSGASRSKTSISTDDNHDGVLAGNSFNVKKPFDDRQPSYNAESVKIERAKRYLLMKVDNRIKQLNPFKARIVNMTVLKSSDKDKLVVELNDEISQLQAYLTEIKSCETKDELRIVADKIKTVWLQSSESVKHAEEKIVALKENQLIQEAVSAAAGIQKRIDVLKSAGKETRNYETLLAEYGKKIDAAKQDVKSANATYLSVASASSEGEKAVLMKDTHELLKSAQADIRAAYKLVSKEAREDFSRRYR